MSRPLHNIKQTINSCKRKPDLSSFALSKILLVWLMMFNVSFNNGSAISRRSVLLVEETGVPGENHQPATTHLQTLSL